MPGDSLKILSFDTGIEQILRGGDPESSSLPDGTAALLPSEEHPDRHLDQVIQTPSLEDHILASLKPEISDKNVIIPSRYGPMIEETYEALRQAAEKSQSDTNTDLLEEAAHLLEEDQELMQLLMTYRNLLHKA